MTLSLPRRFQRIRWFFTQARTHRALGLIHPLNPPKEN